jgi:hypothetical protein
LTGGGTGIAGVASTAQGTGIHIINDHSKYKEWEFVYDLKNDKSALGAGAMQQQLMQQQLGAAAQSGTQPGGTPQLGGAPQLAPQGPTVTPPKP